MLKKNLSKSALVVALLTTTVIWRGTTAYAEDPNQAFTLDPMIVTAQRTETRDLDTPATTNIITEQNIKEAGYKNVFDAIEHQVGLTSTGYGDAGQDFGFSSGRTVIRGYDRGTLVMVDGIPMNLKNYNSLDGIPIDMVQQIEIIKGAAGTLYGSEAMGGVVNVITKRPVRRRPRKQSLPPQLMLSPMIDMIFLLLVFFIVSTMYMSEIKTIPIRLPVAQNSETVSKSNFAVTVKKDGVLYLEDNKIEMKQLVANAAAESKRDAAFSVIIRADGEANYKTVIKLMDELKGAGVTRFGLATDLGDGK